MKKLIFSVIPTARRVAPWLAVLVALAAVAGIAGADSVETPPPSSPWPW